MLITRRVCHALALTVLCGLLAGCGGNGDDGGDGATTTERAIEGTEPAPVTDVTTLTGSSTTLGADGAPILAGGPMARCAIQLQPAWCGTLTVPEDHSVAGGRTIDLRVVVVPRSNEDAAAGTPFYALAGGPGGAASDALGWIATTFTGVHERSDIVLVDQRGTGGSNRLTAPPLPDLDGLSADEARSAASAWWAQALAAAEGSDPARYTTADAVDDLDDVRAALGHDRIDLYGASYGATVAQYYAARHGDHLRSMVLDGATPVDVAVFEHVAPNSQLALDALVERCATDPACSDAFPRFGDEVAQLLATLATEPVTLDDATVEPVVVTAGDLALAIHHALLDSATAALLPALVHAAATGAWAQVAGAIGSVDAPADELLMSWVIRCSEPWARFDPATVEQLGAGSYVVQPEVDLARAQQILCAAAPDGSLPSAAPEPADAVHPDVPVLVVTGSADPQDPPGNLATLSARFPRSTVVVVPGQGHTVAHLGCMPALVDAFVASADPGDIDTACIDAGGAAPPPFVTGT